jgi:hypothetical protein
MSTISSNELPNISSVAKYPSTAGIVFGLASELQTGFKPHVLTKVSIGLGGTLGSGSPFVKGQAAVLNPASGAVQWMDVKGLELTANGLVSGYSYGNAFRLDADPGITPGTGANAPRYLLNTQPTTMLNTGEYSGTYS